MASRILAGFALVVARASGLDFQRAKTAGMLDGANRTKKVFADDGQAEAG
jgi:hypothetical protein